MSALGSTSLEPARENVETLYQRGTCIPSELLRSPHLDRPEIYILNVQKVWIESKKGNILQRQHQALPSRGLVDDIMMWLQLKVFCCCCCLLSPLESLKLGSLEMRVLVQH